MDIRLIDEEGDAFLDLRKSMTKRIIFVADDFGMSPEINEAILYSRRNGALEAAALMMGQSGTDKAVAMARANPDLQVGWHLHLNDSQPTTRASWPWGSSPARAGISIAFSREGRELMRREVIRQWELFQATGLPCRLVNCHHHLHAHPVVFRTLVEILGTGFKGWIRLGRLKFIQANFPFSSGAAAVDFLFWRERRLSTWPSPDTLWGVDRLFAMRAEEVRAAIATLPDGFHEFLFHPRTLACPDTQCLLQLRQSPSP